MTSQADAQQAFSQRLGELRPKLHRYCARMTGSVVDGEDVVQDALVKALEAFSGAEPIGNLEGWLFRIAHNAALDSLRQRARRGATSSEEDPDMIFDSATPVESRQIVATNLRTLIRLPVAQRSCVILADVLGYSLEEVGAILDASVPAVKASLHRARSRLFELAQEPDDRPQPVLAQADRARLAAYADRFNAHDFDAVRDMLADEVRLELVSRTRVNGRQKVSNYFGNYSKAHDWRLDPGLMEGRPALLVHDPAGPPQTLLYFILLEWAGDRIVNIRDFRHARYAIESAEFLVLN